MNQAESFNDIGDLHDNFYDPKRKTGSAPEPGQIVYCPVVENDRRLRIGDVTRVDSYAHTQVAMNIRDQQPRDFQGKEGRLPIKGLELDTAHELVITRAKRRPCLVLGCCSGVDPASITHELQRKLVSKALYPVFLLAPVFHVSLAGELGSFGPIVTARIKCLMYPEFFYLRQSGGILRVPSVARLDRMFLQAPHPGLGLELTDLFLDEGIFELAVAQVLSLLGQPLSQLYLDLRGLMLTTLPEQAGISKP